MDSKTKTILDQLHIARLNSLLKCVWAHEDAAGTIEIEFKPTTPELKIAAMQKLIETKYQYKTKLERGLNYRFLVIQTNDKILMDDIPYGNRQCIGDQYRVWF